MADKMTADEALEALRPLVSRFATPMLALEAILESALEVRANQKQLAAEVVSLQKTIDTLRSQAGAAKTTADDAKKSATDETQRANKAIADAKAQQQQAEKQAAAAVARIVTDAQRKDAELTQRHSNMVAAMNGEIAALDRKKAELEAGLKALKERIG